MARSVKSLFKQITLKRWLDPRAQKKKTPYLTGRFVKEVNGKNWNAGVGWWVVILRRLKVRFPKPRPVATTCRIFLRVFQDGLWYGDFV